MEYEGGHCFLLQGCPWMGVEEHALSAVNQDIGQMHAPTNEATKSSRWGGAAAMYKDYTECLFSSAVVPKRRNNTKRVGDTAP